MELPEAEDLLFGRLSAPQMSAASHLRALEYEAPRDLADVAGIGVDTNILKALRRDPTFADRFFVTAASNQTAVIAPGQCVIEYWNNHKVFALEQWTQFQNELSRLGKHIVAAEGAGHDQQRLTNIREIVQEIARDLEESQAPGYLKKSRDLIASLFETGTMPMVSRSRFAELASIRFSSKMPPGWEDGKTKASPFGDFFAWCDFLLGALCVSDPKGRTKFLFVTDEAKADWRTGPMGHPSLLAEFDWVRGAELSIIGLEELRSLLKSDNRMEPAAPSAPETD